MRPIALILPILLLLAACDKPTTMAPRLDQRAVEEETLSQRQIAQATTKYNTPVTIPELDAMKARLQQHGTRVRDAGQNLCRNMGREPSSCTYPFEIKVDDALNAYADGKTIYVTPAMMRFASEDEMLGIVLSHEYAHNLMGHIDSRKRNVMAGMAVGSIADILAQSQGISTGGKLGEMGGGLAMRSFSPDFEQEADYVGMYIMALAGYDITKAADLWRRMTASDPNGAFLDGTHPSNPKRYVLLNHTRDEIIDKVRRNVLLTPNQRPKS